MHVSPGTWTTGDTAMRSAIMALMCASRDNDFSAMDSGVKVPTHLIEAMVQFLVSASQG